MYKELIRDFFTGNYGCANLETEFKHNYKSVLDDKRLMKTLDRLFIVILDPNKRFYDGQSYRYFGAYSSLRKLISTRLSSGSGEDVEYLDNVFEKGVWS